MEVIRLRATESPFMEREVTLGYAGLNLVRQSDASTWDFDICGLGYLCLAPHREKRIESYSESRLVVDGSK